MKNQSVLLNAKGLSIVETLIALGIMSIMMVGFTSMISNQHKETKSVAEVLAGLDLQKNLISVLSHGSVCSHILNNPSQITFNSNSLPQTLTPALPIYANVESGVPGAVVAQIGQQASVYSTSMVIKSIKLNVINGSGSMYTANWIIDFDESKSVRPHKPITIATVLNVDNANPAAAKVVDCMSEQVANRYIQSCTGSQVMAGYNADGSIKCQDIPAANSSNNIAAFAGRSCPANQTVTGFNSDGSIICATSARIPAAAGGGGGTPSASPAASCSGGHQTMGGYVCPYR